VAAATILPSGGSQCEARVKTRLLVRLFVLSMLAPYMSVIFRALYHRDHLD
jgi:hypothetical protein